MRLKHVSPCRRDLRAAYGLLLIYMLIQSQNSISAFYLYRTISRDRINYASYGSLQCTYKYINCDNIIMCAGNRQYIIRYTPIIIWSSIYIYVPCFCFCIRPRVPREDEIRLSAYIIKIVLFIGIHIG